MKKLLTVTLGIILAMSVVAFATETRVITMGENYNVLLDESNVWMYTGRVFNYPNIASGEFYQDYYYPGGASTIDDAQLYDFGQFGINFKFGEKKPWVLGAYFQNGDPILPGSYSGRMNYLQNDFYSLPDNRRISLLYGRQFSSYNFGFGWDYAYSSVSQEVSGDTVDITDNFKEEEKFSYMKFSLGLTPTAGNWDIAAHFGFGSWTNKETFRETGAATDSTREYTKPDGYMDFMVMGRYFKQLNPTITLVPHASFAFGKHGVEFLRQDTAFSSGDKYSSKLTTFDLGVGFNYTPTTNVLAVFDFGFEYFNIKDKYDYADTAATDYELKWTYFTKPYWKIGMEGEVFNWMDIRLGATSWWEGDKYEAPASYQEDGYDPAKYTSKRNASWNYTYLGVGLNFGKFHLDTYTDPQIILDGFNFISGHTNDNLNFRVSALYELM